MAGVGGKGFGSHKTTNRVPKVNLVCNWEYVVCRQIPTRFYEMKILQHCNFNLFIRSL